MKYWYDCEFLENGKTIDLISIAIVAEDGRELYAVNRDAPWRRIKKHGWLMANVVPHLPQPHGDWILQMPKSWIIDFASPYVCRKTEIARGVRDFLLAGDGEPELWAYYGAYDHVAYAQLWGPMIVLPDGLPMFTHELMQLWEAAGRPEKPAQTDEHDARADARWNRALWQACMDAMEAAA